MGAKPFVIHPLLFGIYPIVFLYAHNVDALRVLSTLRPLALTLLGVVILLLLLQSILRDRHKAGIICSSGFLLFFSYQHIYDFLQVVSVRHHVLLPGLGIISLFAIIMVIRTRRPLHLLTRVSNVVALFLVIMAFFQIAQFNIGLTSDHFLAQLRREDQRVKVEGTGPPTEALPDIYYIILDAYSRADVLRDIYRFDNGPFLDFLRQKGFYVAGRSTSNYPHTLVSIASSLNYAYINSLSDIVGEQSGNRSPLKAMIEDHRIYRFLRRFNYTFIVFASGSETTEHNRNADVVLRPLRAITEFERILVYGTAFPAIQDFLVRSHVLDKGTLGVWNFQEWRQRIIFIFEGLKNVPQTDSPRFVFAHIVDPHPPFVFNREGGSVIREDTSEAYVDEVLFLNNKVRDVVTEILSKADREPIIILQGDHGFVPPDRSFPQRVSLQSQFSILNAYYLPDGGQDRLYESISPVNSFRIILNHYFGTNYELLPDENYYSTVRHPYRLTNVTHEVKDGKDDQRNKLQGLTR
ncbi:MAG: hypothetical protein ACE5JU_17820 [Candidatus Binatia bacterium]